MRKDLKNNIEAKKKITGSVLIVVLIIMVFLSYMFVPIISADTGTIEYVGKHDWAVKATTGFFYSNSTGSYIITLGGYSQSQSGADTDVYRTNLDTNTTVKIGDINTARYKHCIVFDELNRTFYIMGGSTPTANNIQAFCLDNNTGWGTGETLPSSRTASMQGVWYNGICWMFCGEQSSPTFTDTVFCYCPANNTAWTNGVCTSTPVNVNGVGYPGTGNKAYIFGGQFASGDNFETDIVEYNMDTGSHSKVGDLPVANGEIFVSYNNYNGKYYYAGGLNGGTAVVEVDGSTWSANVINNMSTDGAFMTAYDNRTENRSILIFNNFDSPTYYTDIYKLDLGLGEETPEQEDVSNVSLVLNNDIFTFQGEQGNTTYANSSGSSYETGEFNISYNGTTQVDYIRINFTANLHTNITNSNIAVQFNIQNSSYNNNWLTLSDGANTIWLNNSEWGSHTYMIGSSPFPIQTNTSLWWRSKITIPTGIGNETYSNTNFITWDAGYYQVT